MSPIDEAPGLCRCGYDGNGGAMIVDGERRNGGRRLSSDLGHSPHSMDGFLHDPTAWKRGNSKRPIDRQRRGPIKQPTYRG
jgi:hypothetical protein